MVTIMKWFQDSKDLIGITIAALAVAVSFVTVLLQRRQQQRAAYREIYSALMSEDLHRGRWLVNSIKEIKDVQEKSELDLRLMYRTLGVFDNLAMYESRRVVPSKWVLDVWHHPLRQMREGASIIRREAESRGQTWAWPQLWTLFEKAADYHSTLACCAQDGGGGDSRIRRWRRLPDAASTAPSPRPTRNNGGSQ